jgi:hypothetical protein
VRVVRAPPPPQHCGMVVLVQTNRLALVLAPRCYCRVSAEAPTS